MKLLVTCQTCGKTLSIVEKDFVTNEDVELYQATSSCEDDGPDNIVVSKTVS